MDKDSNGRISVDELQCALNRGNFRFSVSTVAHLIRVHDTSGRGEIDLEEFRKLHEFLISMQSSFTAFDTNKTGTLSPEELHQAVTHAGPQCLRVWNGESVGFRL